MDRVFNFSAGPAMLPLEVLEKAQKEMLSLNGTGMSILEVSHRSQVYDSIHNKCIQDLRDMLNIPTNFKILLVQGGGTLQFACIPLNMLKTKRTANYLVTGSWSVKAVNEAEKYCKPHIVATGKSSNFTTIPETETWDIDPNGAYFHYCPNETVLGLEFDLTPEMLAKIGDVPIVADLSSNFLSKSLDFNNHAVIYAHAQKNAGLSGVTVVIVREDYLGHAWDITPTVCDWKVMADSNSLYNTPPCHAIYICGLFYDYMIRNGGISTFEEMSKIKAELVYNAIKESDGFYTSPVDERFRSKMNAAFYIKEGDKLLEQMFVQEAEQAGLMFLNGHRSVGGLRASLYNGMPVEGAAKLARFMKEFQVRNSNSIKQV